MKIKTLSLLLASFFATSPLLAMYQSNPMAPELIDEGFVLSPEYFLGLKVGYQFDQVFNRYMGVTNSSGHVDDSSIFANRGVVTANIMDRVEVWGSGGAAIFHFSNQVNPTPDIGGPAQKIDYKTNNDWIWGVGGRAAIVSWNNVSLGASASYQASSPKVRWNTNNGVPFSSKARFRYSEWQVGIGVAYKIQMFIPYLGGTYSMAKACLHHIPAGAIQSSPPITRIKMHNKRHYGLTVGCDIAPGRILDIGVEFRMLSEQAITVKGDIKF